MSSTSRFKAGYVPEEVNKYAGFDDSSLAETGTGNGCEECEASRIPERYAHWVNDLGHAAISRISVSLAGVMAQMLSGRFISAWQELAGTPGKDQTLLIGRENNLADLIRASRKDARLYVQIPFSFTQFTSRSLPQVAMRFHSISFAVMLAPLQKLIKVSHSDVTVVKTSDGQSVTKSDVDAMMDTNAVFLDLEERKLIANGTFSQLWHQMQSHEANYKGAAIRAPLTFNHPSRCLLFMVQRKELDEGNFTFDYSSPVPDEDPIKFARLVIQTTSRFAREGQYFRKVVPYNCFPRTLEKGRYLYAMSYLMVLLSHEELSEVVFLSGTEKRQKWAKQ